MPYFNKNEVNKKDQIVNLYYGASAHNIATLVDNYYTSRGYKLIKGEAGNGTYEKGNRIMRILFGAFIKYFKMTCTTQAANADYVRVTIRKATSGFSGGLIGIGQVNKEMKAIGLDMQKI